MPSYHFPGYPSYLDAAAKEIGCPEVAGPSRRITALANIANLCAQAAVAAPCDVVGILSKASEASNHLRVAHRAAELMLIDVRNARGLSPALLPPATTNPIPGPQHRPKASR